MKNENYIRDMREIFQTTVRDGQIDNTMLRRWKYTVNLLDLILEQDQTYPEEETEIIANIGR